jgi:hypothetical protein
LYKPQSWNLTPSPFPTREGEKIKASLLAGERFGERSDCGHQKEKIKASLLAGERFGERSDCSQSI